MKKLFKKFCYFAPLLFIMLYINYHADPYYLYSNTENEDRWIIEKLSEGNNIVFNQSINERYIQRRIIELSGEQDKNYDLVAVGSSRSMQINSDMFPNQTFFNSSVTGASIEDYVSIAQIYIKNNIDVKQMVVGVDPWVFNSHSEKENQEAFKIYYSDFLNDSEEISVFTRIIEKIKMMKSNDNKSTHIETLFSLKYLQHSLYGEKEKNKSEVHQVIEGKYHTKPVKLADGSVTASAGLRNAAAESVFEDVIKYLAKGKLYELESFNNIDSSYKELFEKWIKHLQKNNIEVIFFLPPYHPKTYEHITNNDKYKMVNEVEVYLKNYALEKNIKVIGSYNPEKISFTQEDFYDFMHPRREAVERLFSEEYKKPVE